MQAPRSGQPWMRHWLWAAAAYNLSWGAAVVIAPQAFFCWADIALVREIFPLRFGLTILTNDLVWWLPFAGILWAAWGAGSDREASSPEVSP